MSTTEPDEAKVRSLRRWMWALIALAFVLMVLGGMVFKLAPDLVSDALSKLMGAAVVAGIVAYLFARGGPAYRKARASWVGAWVLLLGVGPAMYVANSMEQRREAEKVVAIIDALAADIKKADNLFAERMSGAITAKSRGVIGSPALIDAAARRDARSEVAGAIKVIDEGLASRGRLAQEAIAAVQATRAASRLKESAVAELRAAAAREPLAVRMLKAVRAFLVKADEVAAFVEANAAGMEARGEAIEIAEPKLLERYQALMAELAAAQDDVRSLK